MSTAIDTACRELQALLGEEDLHAEIIVRRDGRVTIRTFNLAGYLREHVPADLTPGSAHPLPSVAIARMVRP